MIKNTFLRGLYIKMPRTHRDPYTGENIEMCIKTFYDLWPDLRMYWFAGARLGLQQTCRSKNLFDADPWINLFSSQIYYPTYAYPGEQSKLLFLSSASYFSCSFCFYFPYLLHSGKVSSDCATFSCPNKPMEG